MFTIPFSEVPLYMYMFLCLQDVSVGNLPPGASVLTYVDELVIKGDSIVFLLPGNVAL